MEVISSPAGGDHAFPPTQWTIIVTAVSNDPERAREALERLCTAYRQPIVNWFRRKDLFHQDPQDLAHEFIAYLLAKKLLGKVELRTGRFRSFLAASMKNFLRDSWDRIGAKKRGGDVEKVSLAENDVEIRADGKPDSQLDVDFALTIHARVMASLAPPRDLKPLMFQKDATESRDEIAARLKKTSVALRKEISRLRHRHLEYFQDEVAQLVSPVDRPEETRYLYELLFRNLPPD